MAPQTEPIGSIPGSVVADRSSARVGIQTHFASRATFGVRFHCSRCRCAIWRNPAPGRTDGEPRWKASPMYPIHLFNKHCCRRNSNTIADGPVRQSRNRNSEYLPQRRKGRKVRRLRVKSFIRVFVLSPQPWRLGGRNSRLRVLSMPDYLRRPHKFLTIVIRSARSSEILIS